MPTVTVFSDYACPWCYLGRARLKAAAPDATVQVVHFPLSPDTPEEGVLLTDYARRRGFDIEAASLRLRLLMEEAGLPYPTNVAGRRVYNTRRAQELALWAVHQPGGEAIHDALFHAYQVDNLDVHDTDVLLEVVRGLGLDQAEAAELLADGRMGPHVDQHWALAHKLGVRSVPTFVVGGKGVVGAQPIEVLRRLVADPAA